jgi:hypothetical protein
MNTSPSSIILNGRHNSVGSEIQAEDARERMLQAFVEVYRKEGYQIHGVRGLTGYDPPPVVKNRGFGSGQARVPDIAGIDTGRKRIVFGVIRPDRKSLDTEEALEEYNVFLDHNEGLGDQASLLLVLMPGDLLPEFTAMITHYVHREYWHRILPVAFSPQREPLTKRDQA